MNLVRVTHRVRYPPFESDKLLPEFLPIAENSFEIDGAVAPPFVLGNEKSWLIERSVEGDVEFDLNHIGKIPLVIEKQRTGWYLLPHPIHARARKIINFAVVVLLTCLFYLFTAPIQTGLGIPVFGTGKIRLGMLDYPFLAVIVVPLIFTPIILRVIANFGDLKRQKTFLNSEPKSPVIKVKPCESGDPLHGEIKLEEPQEGWKDLKLTWRVGILPPARHRIFSSLDRKEDGQPPPGLTTPLPHHWEKGLDDGTGMGEDAPMYRHDVPGGVFLRPMRIMEQGGSENLDLSGGKFKLEPPEMQWPGCMYGDLVRVHWELIVRIKREKNGPLLWVLPLKVSHKNEFTENKEITINDGRTESFTL